MCDCLENISARVDHLRRGSVGALTVVKLKQDYFELQLYSNFASREMGGHSSGTQTKVGLSCVYLHNGLLKTDRLAVGDVTRHSSDNLRKHTGIFITDMQRNRNPMVFSIALQYSAQRIYFQTWKRCR